MKPKNDDPATKSDSPPEDMLLNMIFYKQSTSFIYFNINNLVKLKLSLPQSIALISKTLYKLFAAYNNFLKSTLSYFCVDFDPELQGIFYLKSYVEVFLIAYFALGVIIFGLFVRSDLSC